jgi:hypothetical protein
MADGQASQAGVAQMSVDVAHVVAVQDAGTEVPLPRGRVTPQCAVQSAWAGAAQLLVDVAHA